MLLNVTAVLEPGSTAFMLLAASLVMLMTPGLALFYGGLATKRNILGIMIQSFFSLGWTTVLWFIFGYSLCFSGGIGGARHRTGGPPVPGQRRMVHADRCKHHVGTQ